MKKLLISLCLLPCALFSKDPQHHRQQLIVESQIYQIRQILEQYQPVITQQDFEDIQYKLYIIQIIVN